MLHFWQEPGQWRPGTFFRKKLRYDKRNTKGAASVITHEIPVDSPESSNLVRQGQVATLRQLRHELLCRYRPILQQGAGPIRVMARMVAELERQCRALNIAEEVI